MVTALDPSKHSARRKPGPSLSPRDTHLQAAPELLLDAAAAAAGVEGVDGVHELLGIGRLESGSHSYVVSGREEREREMIKEMKGAFGYVDYVCL